MQDYYELSENDVMNVESSSITSDDDAYIESSSITSDDDGYMDYYITESEDYDSEFGLATNYTSGIQPTRKEMAEHELWLYNNPQFNRAIQSLKTRIDEFSYRNNVLNKIAMDQLLQAIHSNRYVRKLVFTCVNITTTSIKQLTNMLENNSRITSLQATACGINDTSIEYIADMLEVNYSLTALDLSHNKRMISDRGISSLAISLMQNKVLRELYVEVNNISDSGAQALANVIQENNKLREIWIKDNRIGAIGLKSLLDSLENNTSIMKLMIGANCSDPMLIEKCKQIVAKNLTLQQIDIISDLNIQLLPKVEIEKLQEISFFTSINMYGYRKQSIAWLENRGIIFTLLLIKNNSQQNELHKMPIELIAEIFSQIVKQELPTLYSWPGNVINWYTSADDFFKPLYMDGAWELIDWAQEQDRYEKDWKRKVEYSQSFGN